MKFSVKKRKVLWLGLLLVADLFLLVFLLGDFDRKPGKYAQTIGSAKVERAAPEKEPAAEVKQIALTFDDGPNDTYTLPLLEGLRERGVKATFFLLGQEVTENPEIAKQIATDGHMIGNHSFYHKDLSAMSTEEATTQVSLANEVIFEVTGQYPQLIRPPFGRVPEDLVYEPPMVEALWTIDSRDWELSDVGTIMQNVLPHVQENAIILMHDASQSSVQAALAIVDCLQERGYTFVTLDEILFD